MNFQIRAHPVTRHCQFALRWYPRRNGRGARARRRGLDCIYAFVPPGPKVPKSPPVESCIAFSSIGSAGNCGHAMNVRRTAGPWCDAPALPSGAPESASPAVAK